MPGERGGVWWDTYRGDVKANDRRRGVDKVCCDAEGRGRGEEKGHGEATIVCARKIRFAATATAGREGCGVMGRL